MTALFQFYCGFSLFAGLVADDAALKGRESSFSSGRNRGGRHRSRCRISGALVLCFLSVMPLGISQAAEPVFDIDIPATNAAEALNRLAEQTGSVMLFSYDLARARDANAVRGRYTLQEGLELLLRDTGLSGGLSDKRVVIIADEGNMPVGKGETVKKRGWFAGIVAALAATSAVEGRTDQEVQSEARPTPLSEIIVTAQKREERLSDVPLSVDVLDGARLDSSTQEGLNDSLRAIPSVSLAQSVFAGISYLNMRGVGGRDFEGSSPVAYYLDAAPFALVKSALIPDTNDFDLERVEVLRGPQGTLFGANAENGVIRIITHDANVQDWEFKTRVSGSSTEDGGGNYRGDAAVNVPIVQDVFGARLVLGYQDQSGWIDRPNNKDGNSSETKNARLRVLAKPNNDLTLRFATWVSRNSFDNPSLGNDQDQNIDEEDSPGSTDFDVYSVEVAYSFPVFTLTSTSSYLDFANTSTVQLQQFGLPGNALLTNFESHVFSQEFLLNSQPNSALEWTLGAFYRNGEDRLLQVTTPDPTLFAIADFSNESESYAAFGQVTGHLTPTLKWTAGLRYFHDSVSVGENVSPGPPGTPLTSDSADFDATTPRVALTWIPNPDLTVYASYSQGFRSGFPQDPGVIRLDPDFPAAEPERLHNYEIGTHVSSADGRVRVDAAAYYIRWDEVQQSLSVADPDAPGGFITAIVNGTSASGPGVDLAFAVEPVDRLQLGLSVGWNDLRFDEDVISGGEVLFPRDTRLNLSPEVTAAASLDYSFQLGGDFEGVFGLSANYSDPQTTTNAGFGTAEGEEIFLSNARFAVHARSNWTATLFVNNLANENPIVTPYVLYTPAFGFAFDSWNSRTRPRTIGVQLEYSF